MGGAGKLGCNAHIVRLADIQRVSKNDPRGVVFRIYLIINETNNVCNAPFLLNNFNDTLCDKFYTLIICLYKDHGFTGSNGYYITIKNQGYRCVVA